jgi:hypothetical protein
MSFIAEPITVTFSEPPVFEKSPPCPASFTWRGETFSVVEMLETWVDNRRRGRFARNMRPEHLMVAATRGSWGVGRFHFVVRVTGGRIFEIYYDRAPRDANDRKGNWFLFKEKTN